ncbi:Ltp family lipoprotein [Microbacterium halotolerans]|uniref:Ltp family lipoprotein n=1 Tax=Microbacterium halotolerans TaxID=246613 RepID=UPI0013C2DFCA|nr:Ltp family lipoprotein [Microbacterium halotolerans]
MTDQQPTPGWYPAPHANGENRYWDGSKWLEPATDAAGSPEQPKKSRKGLWITLSIIGGVIVLGGIGGALGLGDDPDDDATPAASQTDEPTQEPTQEPNDEPAAQDEAEEPEPEEPEPEPEKPSLTVGQENAVGKAETYLDLMGFSRDGLIEQLEFDGFTTEEATFAVDNVAPDWNKEAAEKAESYIDLMEFSRQGLIDQLVFDGFTQEQAEHGASTVGY